MKIDRTPRGFEIIGFLDRYGQSCSLQQSSLADYELPGSSAVWFGTVHERMHLDRDLVGRLLPFLQNWLKTGSFQKTQEDIFIQGVKKNEHRSP